MAAERISIDQFLSLSEQFSVIDVRSPGEYQHAHIPGAYSLPLFTNEERAAVGTAYKQQSREAAIKIGLDFFGPKMKTILEAAEAICIKNKQQSNKNAAEDSGKTILVYCWRGGMRSGAVSWLLDLYGFKVFTLVAGYKKFRNHVLDTFSYPYQFNILGGYTGSGKTELLKKLQSNGEPVIDLEGIAGHKGSAFGNIGLPNQPTQEMFENVLAIKLAEEKIKFETTNKPIWLEDESQRIGHINIPSNLWNTMRQSPVFFLDIPFEERLKHIVQEYGVLDTQKLVDATCRIKEKLGGLQTKQVTENLQSGNHEEGFRILLKYYDKYYSKSLHNREGLNSLLNSIHCKSITTENTSVLLHHTHSKTSEI